MRETQAGERRPLGVVGSVVHNLLLAGEMTAELREENAV